MLSKSERGERGGGLARGRGGSGFDERGKLCMGGLGPALVGGNSASAPQEQIEWHSAHQDL